VYTILGEKVARSRMAALVLKTAVSAGPVFKNIEINEKNKM